MAKKVAEEVTSKKCDKKTGVEYSTFVEAWKEASDKEAPKVSIAESLGIESKEVDRIAVYLRGRGVSLPMLKRLKSPKVTDADVEELNSLLA